MEESRNEKDFEIDLKESLTIFSKYKRMIAYATGFVAIASVVISLLLPSIYRGETRILPPQQGSSSMATQLLNQLSGSPALGVLGAGLGIKTPGEMYIGMLKSRTVYDRIIERFALERVYRVKYREDARKELDDAIEAKVKDGIITLKVEDRDPKRAAEMANAFVEELRRMTKGHAVTEAAQRRLFFEERLVDAKAALVKSEEAFKGFQERTGALKIDDQARVVIAGLANLRAQIAAREVQQKVMRTFATSQNPDLQRVEEEILGLREEMRKLETKGGSGNDPLMSTGRMPAIGTEYIRRFRDFKYNETLFELLSKQFEMAKLDEARDAVVFQVIDKAVTPERRVKPRRFLIVFVSTLSGFFLSLISVLLMEYFRSIFAGRTVRGGASPETAG